MRFIKPKFAFTLSELLVSALVLSVILVAMAPIITKRIGERATVDAIKTDGALFVLGGALDPAFPNRCTITSDVAGANEDECTFQIPQGVTSIDAVVVGSGGNGSDAYVDPTPKLVTEKYFSDKTLVFESTKIDPDDGKRKFVRNLKIEYIISGGAGGGRGWGGEGEFETVAKGQEECNKAVGEEGKSNAEATTKYIPVSMNGTGGKNLCVTKYNVGDVGGPDLTVSRSATGSSATPCSGARCCWGGGESNYYTASSTNTTHCSDSASWRSYSTTYSSCTRTVCTYQAAKDACAAWSPSEQTKQKWRLPNSDEVSGWKTIINNEKTSNTPSVGITKYLGNNGLQLCDKYSSRYGAQICFYSNGCKYGNGYFCEPSRLWTNAISSTKYPVYELNEGSFNSSTYGTDRVGFSARCVYELPSPVTANSGSGGGAGGDSRSHNDQPIVIQEGQVEGIINLSLTIGKGGKGATVSPAKNAEDGEPTIVRVQKVLNGITTEASYSYETDESVAGKNGTQGGFGEGITQAQGALYRLAYLSENVSVQGFSLSSSQLPGNGESQLITESQTAIGGQGGVSNNYTRDFFDDILYFFGGMGGTIEDPNGEDGNLPGEGGGGGTAIIDENTGKIKMGDGGDGANGAVVISYELVEMPIAGAGGAGGAMIIGRGIKVNYNETVGVYFKPTVLEIGTDFSIEASSGEDAITNSNNTTAGQANQNAGTVIRGERGGSYSPHVGLSGGFGGSIIENLPYMYGGVGGMSGTGGQGGCGGLNEFDYAPLSTTFINSENCFLRPSHAGSSINGSDADFNVSAKNIVGNNYGTAGSGGGGGGYGIDETTGELRSGQGGAGNPGYVYIWWPRVGN